VTGKRISNRINFVKTMYYKEQNKQNEAIPLVISLLLHLLMFWIFSFPTTKVPNFDQNTEQTLKIQYIATQNKTVVSKSEVKVSKSVQKKSVQKKSVQKKSVQKKSVQKKSVQKKQSMQKRQKKTAALPKKSVEHKRAKISTKSAKLKNMKAIKI